MDKSVGMVLKEAIHVVFCSFSVTFCTLACFFFTHQKFIYSFKNANNFLIWKVRIFEGFCRLVRRRTEFEDGSKKRVKNENVVHFWNIRLAFINYNGIVYRCLWWNSKLKLKRYEKWILSKPMFRIWGCAMSTPKRSVTFATSTLTLRCRCNSCVLISRLCF